MFTRDDRIMHICAWNLRAINTALDYLVQSEFSIDYIIVGSSRLACCVTLRDFLGHESNSFLFLL